MLLDAAEFIRRFLLHVLPSGFHRIRHYGFLASPKRAAAILRLRELIAARQRKAQSSRDVGAGDKAADPELAKTQASSNICPCCGGRMRLVETFARGAHPRNFNAEPAGIDSS
jgi:Putative transposase